VRRRGRPIDSTYLAPARDDAAPDAWSQPSRYRLPNIALVDIGGLLGDLGCHAARPSTATADSLERLLQDRVQFPSMLFRALPLAYPTPRPLAPATPPPPRRPEEPQIVLPPPPVAPPPKREDFRPHLSLLDYLLVIPALRKRSQAEAAYARAGFRHEMDALDRAMAETAWKNEGANQLGAFRKNLARYEQQEEAWQKVLNDNRAAYASVLAVWEENRNNYEAIAIAVSKRLSDLLGAYRAGDKFATEQYLSAAISCSPFPLAFPREVSCAFDPERRLAVLEIYLPDLRCLDITKQGPAGKLVSVTKREHKARSDTVPFAIIVRVMWEAFSADVSASIQSLVVNGYLRHRDPATGHERRDCLMSVMVSREQVLNIIPDEVDPVQCFKAWKGVSASQISDVIPIAPIVRLDTQDHRIVEGRDVLDSGSLPGNLATMEWEDFEHLVRQLFEKEFQRDGVDVKVTQSSRDKGVDALAFDPDPVRGGKMVIQAKRYTKVVDVSAVRDLYGTMINEGAMKGILVTTSFFGRDSYEFAAGKPMTLIDGSNLLFLLEKHGYRLRIDLAEARRILREASQEAH